MAVEVPAAKPYPAWKVYFGLPLAKLICRMIFWVLGPISGRGGYRVPSKGPVLILANHLADVDPIVVQVACPRAVHFMAKSELFEMKVIGPMVSWFESFPVKRGEPDRASMRHAIDVLKMGEVVGVFPEGQLSEDGELQELKAGVALIIRQAASPDRGSSESGRPLSVICCGLRNTNKVMPYGRVTPRLSWSKVRVEWGEVREFTRESTTEEIVEWATAQLRELTSEDVNS